MGSTLNQKYNSPSDINSQIQDKDKRCSGFSNQNLLKASITSNTEKTGDIEGHDELLVTPPSSKLSSRKEIPLLPVNELAKNYSVLTAEINDNLRDASPPIEEDVKSNESIKSSVKKPVLSLYAGKKHVSSKATNFQESSFDKYSFDKTMKEPLSKKYANLIARAR